MTTLNFFQFKGEALEDFNEIIADFEAENPDIRVVQNQVADADTIIRTLLVKDKAPDVITLNANGGFGKLAQAGVFYDFSDEPVLQTINPAVQEILARSRQQGGRGQRPRLRQQRQRRDLQPGDLRGAGSRGPRDLGRVHRRVRCAAWMPASRRSTAPSPTRGPGCRRSTRWARTRRRATSGIEMRAEGENVGPDSRGVVPEGLPRGDGPAVPAVLLHAGRIPRQDVRRRQRRVRERRGRDAPAGHLGDQPGQGRSTPTSRRRSSPTPPSTTPTTGCSSPAWTSS